MTPDSRRNQALLVFDSLRWDVFQKAKIPFLKKLGKWKLAYTPGNYTFPAHMSFFVGKIPQTLDNTPYYDTVATRFGITGRKPKPDQLWRLGNPEAPRPSKYTLEGQNIISGFRAQGYLTIGAGAVNWFNPDLPAGKYLTEPFEHFFYKRGPNYASHESAEEQVQWVLDCLRVADKPYFLFINFGETHHQYLYKNCPWHGQPNPYGNARECRRRQQACLEYLDKQVEHLLTQLKNLDLVICSDHGEAMGEDGLWGHGFHHPKIWEVPLLIKAGY